MGNRDGFDSAARATGAEGVACISGADTNADRAAAGGEAGRCVEESGSTLSDGVGPSAGPACRYRSEVINLPAM